ncbi:hypothetical protein BHM03_00009422 [Ensete ventricosum]|nr:hypothetical protein BHM03_00009422 [Ensete ventricosum]
MTDFRSSFRHDEFWVLPPSWRISSHLFAMAGFGVLVLWVSKVSYNDIYAWRTTICFIGLVLPSKASSDER